MDLKPYIINSRWYRVFIESNNTSATISTIDDDIGTAHISGTSLVLPPNFHLIDVKYDKHISGGTATSAKALTATVSRTADGCYSLTLGDVTTYDWQYVYVNGYYEPLPEPS